MEKQQKPSTVLLTVLQFLGVIGAAFSLMPYLLDSRIWDEIPGDTIVIIGDVMYSIALAVFTWLSIQRIKELGLDKPSTTILSIFIATLVLSILASPFTSDVEDMFTFADCIVLVNALMMIVVAIAYLGKKETKSIGMWMLIAFIAGEIVLFFFEPSEQKWIVKLIGLLTLWPVERMIKAYIGFILKAASNKES